MKLKDRVSGIVETFLPKQGNHELTVVEGGDGVKNAVWTEKLRNSSGDAPAAGADAREHNAQFSKRREGLSDIAGDLERRGVKPKGGATYDMGLQFDREDTGNS